VGRRPLVLTGLLLLAGCSPFDPLPRLEPLGDRPRIPAGASPVRSWHADSPVLSSPWGQQTVKVRCRGFFPAGWKRPGDEIWEVTATNQEGKPLPYLGIASVDRGRETIQAADIVPPVDASRLKDGLYIVMQSRVLLSPVVDRAPPGIIDIRPVAVVVEVRRKDLYYFQYELPLAPDPASGG
jgi:hypothetical protein